MKLPKAFLAPISEYAGLPFRLLCRKYGADATIAPLVNATAIARRDEALFGLDLNEKKKNLGVQLFGKEPEEFGMAAKKIEKNFPFVSWFDINCGCPVKKVTRIGAGASLLRSPERVCRIISAVKTCGLPVSVKMRLLPDIKKSVCFCKTIEKAGADFIILHGRTAKQGYGGFADWQAIKKVRSAIAIPLVGNGDITARSAGEKMVAGGYCDSFMIGKAAMKNPMCFRDKQATGFKMQRKVFFEYVKICEKTQALKIGDLRQKALLFFHSFPNCASLRAGIAQAKTIDALFAAVNGFE